VDGPVRRTRCGCGLAATLGSRDPGGKQAENSHDRKPDKKLAENSGRLHQTFQGRRRLKFFFPQRQKKKTKGSTMQGYARRSNLATTTHVTKIKKNGTLCGWDGRPLWVAVAQMRRLSAPEKCCLGGRRRNKMTRHSGTSDGKVTGELGTHARKTSIHRLLRRQESLNATLSPQIGPTYDLTWFAGRTGAPVTTRTAEGPFAVKYLGQFLIAKHGPWEAASGQRGFDHTHLGHLASDRLEGFSGGWHPVEMMGVEAMGAR